MLPDKVDTPHAGASSTPDAQSPHIYAQVPTEPNFTR
jgi:hypothetical protein